MPMAKSTRSVDFSICFMISSSPRVVGGEEHLDRDPVEVVALGDVPVLAPADVPGPDAGELARLLPADPRVVEDHHMVGCEAPLDPVRGGRLVLAGAGPDRRTELGRPDITLDLALRECDHAHTVLDDP